MRQPASASVSRSSLHYLRRRTLKLITRMKLQGDVMTFPLRDGSLQS